MNTKIITTVVYDIRDGYYVEVSPDIENATFNEFYLCHKEYSIKYLMFGISNTHNAEDLIKDNVEDYISIYEEMVS